MVVALDYKAAAEEYKKLRNDGKYKECYHLYQKNCKFKESDAITYIHSIPEIRIYGNNEEEVIADIINKIHIPDLKIIKEEVKYEANDNPLLLAIPVQKVNDRGHLSEKQTSCEEIVDLLIDQKIKQEIQYSNTILSHSVYKLEADKKLTSEGIKNILRSNISNDNIISVIEHGTEKHFEQDYLSSIHILVPQIEALLRLILKSKNVIITKEQSHRSMDKLLGGILEMKELSEIYGSDFIKFLKIVLTEENGINLRNNVSHGWLDPEKFDHANSFLIIMVIVLLATKH